MTIRVQPELVSELWEDSTVLFLVRSSDTDRIRAAVESLPREIYAMDAGWDSVFGLQPGEANNAKYVSTPRRLPQGWMIMVDFGHVPPELRAELPDVVSAALERRGVQEADIELAPQIGDHYELLDGFTPPSRAWLRGRVPGDAPRVLSRPRAALVDAGLTWLRGERKDGDSLALLTASVETPVGWVELPSVLDQTLATGGQSSVTVLSTDFRTHAACVEAGVMFGFGVVLSSGGTGLTGDDLAVLMLRQQLLIRDHAEHLEWAGVLLEPDDKRFLIPRPMFKDASRLTPMWYQLLSPAQLELLGEPPPGAVELPGGKVELTVGQPEQWVPWHPDRPEMVRRARELLGYPH